jgi:hypothetical protein
MMNVLVSLLSLALATLSQGSRLPVAAQLSGGFCGDLFVEMGARR